MPNYVRLPVDDVPRVFWQWTECIPINLCSSPYRVSLNLNKCVAKAQVLLGVKIKSKDSIAAPRLSFTSGEGRIGEIGRFVEDDDGAWVWKSSIPLPWVLVQYHSLAIELQTSQSLLDCCQRNLDAWHAADLEASVKVPVGVEATVTCAQSFDYMGLDLDCLCSSTPFNDLRPFSMERGFVRRLLDESDPDPGELRDWSVYPFEQYAFQP